MYDLFLKLFGSILVLPTTIFFIENFTRKNFIVVFALINEYANKFVIGIGMYWKHT